MANDLSGGDVSGGIIRDELEAGDERGGAAVAADGAVMFEQNLRVILLTASKSAVDRVEPK